MDAYEKKLYFDGKLYGKSEKIEIEIVLSASGILRIRGCVKIRSRIECIGQCSDTILVILPNDPKIQEIVAIWKRWHLNDMRAGSHAQETALRDWQDKPENPHPRSIYAVINEYLESIDLLEDPDYDNYKYGSAWLKEELPQSVVDRIKSW